MAQTPHTPTQAATTDPPTDRTQGLSSAEAQRRLVRFGANAIEEKPIPAWKQFAGKFWAPVPWMLEAAIVLRLVLHRRLEALVIAALLVFNAAAAFVRSSAPKML